MGNESEKNDPRAAAFIEQIVRYQAEIRTYISALIGNQADTDDVLQETLQALWMQASSYDPQRPFLPWARAFALNRVRNYRHARAADKLVFGEDAEAAIEHAFAEENLPPEEMDRRPDALEFCIRRLREEERLLLSDRYFSEAKLPELAKRHQISIRAITMRLARIRDKLEACIVKHLCALDAKDRNGGVQ